MGLKLETVDTAKGIPKVTRHSLTIQVLWVYLVHSRINPLFFIPASPVNLSPGLVIGGADPAQQSQ